MTLRPYLTVYKRFHAYNLHHIVLTQFLTPIISQYFNIQTPSGLGGGVGDRGGGMISLQINPIPRTNFSWAVLPQIMISIVSQFEWEGIY